MFTRKRILIGGGILAMLGAVAVAAAVVWYITSLNDAPARVSLGEVIATLGSTPPDAGVATAAGTQSQAPAARAAGLTGTWTLAPTGGSFVGYRVKEELARIGSTTAVGRTTNVTGTLQFDGSAITEVQVTADLIGLTSDQAMRDNALRRQALETAKYPTATFTLAQPIRLGSVPAEGEPVTATAVGDLTLHGVTRTVSIELQGQFTNGLVVVVGSTDIRFADYGIARPQSFNVLSVEDHGTLELQLVFERAASPS